MVCFGFCGILTTIGYLTLSSLYTYIKYMICKHILLLTFLEEPFLYTVKYFQVFLSNTNFIGLMVKVLANGPGDQGSIPGRVILKTQKMVLMPPCLTLSIKR